uniref:NAD-dependent succinate-semialdehyde dehydrogenase n=1 Tax=Aminobacter niigataensis TaxID=83265 RepID=UPI002852BD38|nr:NAD-dependent succinate-semialdehyde dehydrogenase [Aminobacter niigataensis]WMD00125.1 NAD-dependent succinate-semialdehyde dehydrogenase [Aminobacter niigataensis]
MTTLIDRPLCLIGGEWKGVPVDPVRNPADLSVIAQVPRMGAQDTHEAIREAAKAFPSWSSTLAKARAAVLRRWFDLMIEHRDQLADILNREQGKPYLEALAEIDYAASYVEFYAEEAKRIYGDAIPSHRADARVLVTRQAVGVVAAITPWNFPAAMVTRKVAAALGAGCTVVLKPAPDTPLTAIALFRLAEQAGVPDGVINLVMGDAVEIGSVLTSHPDVRMVTFTGSTAVGKLLMAQAATTVKKVALELGGNSPFIVFDDADLDAAVEGAIAAKFRNAGQTCVCANRFYVQSAIYDKFVDRMAVAVSALKVGAGNEPGVAIGPLINEAAIAKVKAHMADALAKGGKVRAGGNPHPAGPLFFEPTVITELGPDMLVSREETFGPVAAIMRFTDEQEVLELANDTRSGLAAYFYSRDLARVFRVSDALDYGMVGINTGMISAETVPFGGIKESGIGREGSRHGIEEYTDLKYRLIAGLG